MTTTGSILARITLLGALVFASQIAIAEAPKVEAAPDEKVISGMSIVGNDEAPKSLVIVPWKTSELGEGLDVDRGVLDGRLPVDREVFARQLEYYEIRATASLPHAGSHAP